MGHAIYPNINLGLIQGIRLAHALMETNIKICIPQVHAPKFIILRNKFNISYHVGTEEALKVNGFSTHHSTPTTSVGSIHRPLIFPTAIAKYCSSVWCPNRTIMVSFAGLMNDNRKATILNWCKISGIAGDINKIPDLCPVWYKAFNKFRKKLGLTPRSWTINVGDLTLWSSNRGRAFPVKTWDEEYFKLLAKSKFVLCPSGDFIWTYRFFESILCGAIPIIEKTCKVYDGFIFKTMSEPYLKLEWSKEIAQHNYELCIDKITVPHLELESEMQNLIIDSKQTVNPKLLPLGSLHF